MKKPVATIILPLITAIIWGTAFSMQRMASSVITPFSLNAIRFLMGGLLLLALNAVRIKRLGLRPGPKKQLIAGSLFCGLALALASDVQQFGIANASAGKAGFITALYMVLVPVFGLFMGRRLSKRVWFALGLALAGLYFLSISESFTMVPTDGYLLFAAVMFAVQIIFIDRYVREVDGLCLSCGQFLTAGLLSAAAALIFDSTSMEAVMSAAVPIIYMGVFSTGVAYTLQVIALKFGEPTPVTIICSLESVFSVAAGAVILSERLSARELFGCGLMLFAVVISQLPSRGRGKAKGGSV